MKIVPVGLKNILGVNGHFELPEAHGGQKQSFKLSLQNRKVTAQKNLIQFFI
jgi:hypothetical protein